MTKRRARGDGGLRQRPDGYWEATISLGYTDGRRRRKAFTGRTQSEARAKRDLWLRDNRGQTHVGADGSLTLDMWFEKYMAAVPNRVTARGYTSTYVNHIGRWIGDMPLTGLTDDHAERVMAKMMLAGLSPNTVRKNMRLLSALLERAKTKRHIAVNPCDRVELPAAEDVEYSVLDVEQVLALLDVLRGSVYWAPLTVIAYTGLRVSEAAGLMWQHVRLDDLRLDVRWRLLPVPPGLWDWERCKSRTSRRTLPVLPAAREALLSAADMPKAPPPDPHGDGVLVFSRRTGQPVEGRELGRALRRGCRNAGVPEVKPHELRHSAGSFMLNAGVPLWTVSRLLGHSSQAMTEKVYAHMLDSGTDAAAKALAAYMEGTT